MGLHNIDYAKGGDSGGVGTTCPQTERTTTTNLAPLS
jgi:hypothetical protein